MAIGVSFVPSQGQDNTGNGATGSTPSPLQQAVQFLSLRLPKILGQGAIAPWETMNAPGASGLTGDAGPDAFFRQLMRAVGQTPGGQPTPPAQGPVPPPATEMPSPPAAPPPTGIRPGPPRGLPGVAPPYQAAASMMAPVLSGQPGSAQALIDAIKRARLPGGGGQAGATFAPTQAPPQPTAPQPIPAVPAAPVQPRYPFSGMSGTGFRG